MGHEATPGKGKKAAVSKHESPGDRRACVYTPRESNNLFILHGVRAAGYPTRPLLCFSLPFGAVRLSLSAPTCPTFMGVELSGSRDSGRY